MKFNFVKTLIASLNLAVLIASCSSSKQATSISRDSVKGNWTLNTIAYDGASADENIKLTLLDEGSRECLTGSTWALPNNGYGSYTINTGASGCTAGQRDIIWSYQKGDQPVFQYKRLEGGVKAKDITDGYKFKILAADKSTMVLQSEVSVGGKPFFITYSFSR